MRPEIVLSYQNHQLSDTRLSKYNYKIYQNMFEKMLIKTIFNFIP